MSISLSSQAIEKASACSGSGFQGSTGETESATVAVLVGEGWRGNPPAYAAAFAPAGSECTDLMHNDSR